MDNKRQPYKAVLGEQYDFTKAKSAPLSAVDRGVKALGNGEMSVCMGEYDSLVDSGKIDPNNENAYASNGDIACRRTSNDSCYFTNAPGMMDVAEQSTHVYADQSGNGTLEVTGNAGHGAEHEYTVSSDGSASYDHSPAGISQAGALSAATPATQNGSQLLGKVKSTVSKASGACKKLAFTS